MKIIAGHTEESGAMSSSGVCLLLIMSSVIGLWKSRHAPHNFVFLYFLSKHLLLDERTVRWIFI